MIYFTCQFNTVLFLIGLPLFCLGLAVIYMLGQLYRNLYLLVHIFIYNPANISTYAELVLTSHMTKHSPAKTGNNQD